MSILNSNKLYYLFADNKKDELVEIKEYKTTQGFGGRTLRFRNFKELPVYYIEFNSALSLERFDLSEILNTTTLAKIQNKEIFLVLNNSNESFHDVVANVYKNIVIKNSIPESQIILCSESSDIINEVIACSKKYNKQPIKVEWIRQCEFETQLSYKRISNYNLKTLQVKPYTKKFLCLNRRWRPHRATLVGLLHNLNLLDYGYVSLGESDDNKNWNKIWDEIISLSKNNNFICNSLLDNKEQLLSLKPLYVDTNDLKTNRVSLEANTLKYYMDTYFSVVNETNFYTTGERFFNQTGRLLSEKIFKPIACKHPFIVVSVPNFLDKVRELGYKTFSPYIDEFYDTIIDDNERLHAILLEIERLCNLNDAQLQDFLNGVREIVEYNQTVLLNKKIFYDKFYE